MTLVTLSLLGVLVTASPEPASEPEQRARALYETGVAFYRTGDWERAIEHFTRAYELAPLPELLFNIAQAYQLKGPQTCAPAIRFYRRYLEAAPEAQNKGVVEQRLAELSSCPEPPPAPAPPAPDAAVPSPAVEVPAPPAPARAWGPGALVISGAVVAAAGGGVLGWTAAELGGTTSAQCHPHCAELKGALSARAGLSYVLMGVGAAASATGVVLWLRQPSAASAPQVFVAPAGLGVTGGATF